MLWDDGVGDAWVRSQAFVIFEARFKLVPLGSMLFLKSFLGALYNYVLSV